MISNVLSTPWEVYQAVLDYFPTTAQVVEETDERGSNALRITLAPGHSFAISQSVDNQQFKEFLIEQFRQIRMRMQIVPAPLNLERFRMVELLSDWHGFRRITFERGPVHRSCVDVIVNFLKNPVDAALLGQLGFAPNQVETDLSDANRRYFQQIPDNWARMSREERGAIYGNFLRLYPRMCDYVMTLLAQKQRPSDPSATSASAEILENLRRQVSGQESALNLVASKISSQRNLDETIVFLFVGPSGVGKTQLSKAVASQKNNRIVTYPMNQFTDDSHVSRFFGSSTGYIGSTEPPHFVKELEQFKPKLVSENSGEKSYEVENAVILFDEFEKAHQKIRQSLLTIFDEKFVKVQYTDGRFGGNVQAKYTFKKCFIVCTSNMFQREILDSFREGRHAEEIAARFKEWNRRLQPSDMAMRSGLVPVPFSDEMMGRVTIVPFGPVPRGPCYQAAIKKDWDIFRETLKKDLLLATVETENELSFLSFVEHRLYGEGIDLRRIKRFFENEVRAALFLKQEQINWRDLNGKKLVFLIRDEQLWVQLRVLITDIDQYYPIEKESFLV